MSEHEEIQLDLPAYAASGLEGVARARVEEHLRGCAECRGMMETLTGLGETLRTSGESLLEPHPSVSALRDYAGPRQGTGPDAIARHLADCATCSLEVDFWKKRSGLHRIDRPASPRRSLRGSLALASAAGLAAGFSLAVLLRAGRAPAAHPGPETTTATEDATAVGRLLVLPRALRGEGMTASYSLDPKQAFVVVVCPARIPETAIGGEVYRYEIREEAGNVVWSRSMTADDIRGQMTGGVEAVTLLVPARTLLTGRYQFSLQPAAGSAQPLYHAALEVTGPGASPR